MPTAPSRSRSWPENAKLSKHRESLPMRAHPAQDRDLPHNLANEVQGLQINEGSVSRRRPVTRCRLAGASRALHGSPSDFHASAAPADDTRQNVASTTTRSGQIPTLCRPILAPDGPPVSTGDKNGRSGHGGDSSLLALCATIPEQGNRDLHRRRGSCNL